MNQTQASQKPIELIMQETLYPHHLMDPLVIKFITSYLEHRNCTDAARSVGLRTTSGNKLLNQPDVQACIQACVSQWARLNNFDSNEVLERTNEISSIDPLDIYNDDNTIRKMSDIPAKVRRTIKKFKVRELWDVDMNGVKVVTGQIIDIEFWDKVKATELLGKYEGVFKDKVEHTHEIGDKAGMLLLEAAERRAEREVSRLQGKEHTVLEIEAAKVRVDE